jgi:hypothetical protein
MNAPIRDPWTDRLSEYLDDELSSADRAACEAHVAGCAECARVLSELTAVAEHARALPASGPERDLWRGIAARLEPQVLELDARRPSPRRPERAWRWNLGLGQLTAAAAVLVAVTALATWFALNRGASRSQPVISGTSPPVMAQRTPEPATTAAAPTQTEEPPPLASREGQTSTAPAALRFPDRDLPATAADFGVARYDAAIAELETALDKQRGKLDPKTVQVVERNLALIDRAIADARTALAADPASRYLNAHLASTMRQKVDLLRRVNDMASTRI